jgi:hypothetical protein
MALQKGLRGPFAFGCCPFPARREETEQQATKGLLRRREEQEKNSNQRQKVVERKLFLIYKLKIL